MDNESSFILRPFQHLSPEVRDGKRDAGNLLFPDGFVLPPGEVFVAFVRSVAVVWNEWRHRDHGGGFVARHLVEPKVVGPLNQVVRTGVVEIRTVHGDGAFILVGRLVDELLPALMVATGKAVRLRLRDLTTSHGSFWYWHLVDEVPLVMERRVEELLGLIRELNERVAYHEGDCAWHDGDDCDCGFDDLKSKVAAVRRKV